MKLLYLSTWDFSKEASDGVCKKINSQISVFETSGYSVDLIYIRGGKIIYREDGREKPIGKVGNIKKTPAYFKMYKVIKNKKYEWVYNRYGKMDTFYYRVLKRLYRNGAKILIEIPTYPYDGENTGGLLYQLFFAWDRCYRCKIKGVVERIVTCSKDESIFGVPTIRVTDGINLSDIAVAKARPEYGNDAINLMIVAYMQPHHGYERLLKGLKNYYDDAGERNIQCHFVGEGPEKILYEKLVSQYALQDHVTFYGALAGEELDKVFDMCDIGVCKLGGYKCGLSISSELKSREFLAKGLPIISGIAIDILEGVDTPYYLEFPNDASDISIVDIIKFYDEIYYKKDIAVMRKTLRHMAEKYADMSVVMAPIINYMQGDR